jgi:hypothetical protein
MSQQTSDHFGVVLSQNVNDFGRMVTVSDGTGRSAHCLNGDGLIVVAPTVPEGITIGCSPLLYALPNVTPLLFLVVFLCRLQIHEEFRGVTSSSFF